jgi:hypothetical protein
MGWISPTCCTSTAFLPSISKIYPKFSNINIKYECFGENGVNFTNMLYLYSILANYISKIYPKFSSINIKYKPLIW